MAAGITWFLDRAGGEEMRAPGREGGSVKLMSQGEELTPPPSDHQVVVGVRLELCSVHRDDSMRDKLSIILQEEDLRPRNRTNFKRVQILLKREIALLYL